MPDVPWVCPNGSWGGGGGWPYFVIWIKVVDANLRLQRQTAYARAKLARISLLGEGSSSDVCGTEGAHVLPIYYLYLCSF